MYHCVLNIVVFGKNSLLEEIVRSVPPLERFEHTISVLDNISNEALSSSDIILLDLPINTSLIELRNQCRKDASIIVLATPAEILSIDDVSLSAAYLYCEKPLNKKLFKLYFERLLKDIKLQRDYYLSETYLDGVINSIPDMVWFKDYNGIHLKVNKSFCNMVGKTMEDINNKNHFYIWDVSPDDAESDDLICVESEATVMKQKCTCQFTEQVKTQQGTRQFRTYKSPLFDTDGQVMGTVGIGHDVTDLENLGTELEIFLHNMPFAILMWSEKGIVTNINDKFEEHFNVDKKDIIGRMYDDWVTDAFDEPWTVNSEGYVEAKINSDTPSGGKMVEIHEELIYDVFENIVGHLCIYRDVTLERTLEDQILHKSNTDFLTGLYNRRYFYQYINEFRNNQPLSLWSVDLDCFKKINDTYGHQAGDRALIAAASVMRECFSTEFIARVGGDEFLIVKIGECSIEDLKSKSQHLLNCMKKTFSASPQMYTLSASIGISQTYNTSLDIDILIRESDTAMYEAKQRGKAQYCIYDDGLYVEPLNNK